MPACICWHTHSGGQLPLLCQAKCTLPIYNSGWFPGKQMLCISGVCGQFTGEYAQNQHSEEWYLQNHCKGLSCYVDPTGITEVGMTLRSWTPCPIRHRKQGPQVKQHSSLPEGQHSQQLGLPWSGRGYLSGPPHQSVQPVTQEFYRWIRLSRGIHGH